jgi:iron complex outermembrane receptor protein
MLPAASPYGSALAQEAPAADTANALAEVVVTGSRIRGAAPVGSSVVGLERADIESAAGVTVDRVIKEQPMVFDLGVSETSRNQSGGSGNIVWGNAINLHGIGPYATLVLVDGHRVVSNGRSVDPSVMPSLGVERIEIVADGASAIYGSDAVAGVVNLVPRRSLDGVDVSLRYGAANDFNEYQAGIAGGHTWDSGQFMVAYEHSFRSNLSGDDRDYFTSDQRASGGRDYRTTQCNPGTLRVGATAASANTTFAIPQQGVTSATASTLVTGTSNLCDLAPGQDLLPEQTYNSLNATYTQRFNDWLELFADGFYSKREFVRQPAYAIISRQEVTTGNVFFVRPPGTGTTPTWIDYSFSGDLPRDTQTGSSENWEVTPGLRFNLPHGIRMEALFTYGKTDDQSNSYRGTNNTELTRALGGTTAAPVITTADTALDVYGLHRTSAATLARISDQIFLAPTLSTFKGYELRFDGPLFDLPAGAVRFATGYEGQDMTYALGLARGGPTTPMVYRNFDRNVDSGYLELYVPVFGAANAIPAIAKLDLTASIRYDDYGAVGNTSNPKFGINWSPIDSLKLRGSWGTSFRAPLITEIYGNSNNLFGQQYQNPAGGPTLLGFAQSGENQGLNPEEATTWSTGFDWDPTSTTRLSLTYFDITYEKQVANFLSNLNVLSLENELTGTDIILRGAAAGARLYDVNITQGIALARGGPFPGGDPRNATLYVDGRNQNLGTSVTSGIDLQFTQRWATNSIGDFGLNIGASYFTKFATSVTPNGARVDRLNDIYNPLSFKGRAAVTWNLAPVTTQLVVNYVNSYNNTQVTPNEKVDSYMPVDLTVTLHGDDMAWLGSFGAGLAFSLEARNVFDEDPPYVNVGQSGNGGGGFDPTAANPIGRLIGVRVSKNWR